MKYIKTINLWADKTQERILTGDLKLQRGQWCICGSNNLKRCRYVGSNDLTIHIVHWDGSSKATQNKFTNACNLINGSNAK